MVREVTERDFPEVYKLGQCIKAEYQQVNDLKKIISEAFNKIYVYDLNKNIVGFIQAVVLDESIEIIYLVVDHEYHQQGIATHLLSHLISNYPAKNYVILEVKEDNFKARALYEKNGFKKIGIRPKYYDNQDAIIMRKDLSDEEG